MNRIKAPIQKFVDLSKLANYQQSKTIKAI